MAWTGGSDAFFTGMARGHKDVALEMTDFVAEGDRVAAFVRYVNFVNTGAFVEAMKAEA